MVCGTCYANGVEEHTVAFNLVQDNYVFSWDHCLKCGLWYMPRVRTLDDAPDKKPR